MVLGDVSSTYTDIVETVFSSLHGVRHTAGEVEQVVASGRGVMPAGVVKGQDAADVAAYVSRIAQ